MQEAIGRTPCSYCKVVRIFLEKRQKNEEESNRSYYKVVENFLDVRRDVSLTPLLSADIIQQNVRHYVLPHTGIFPTKTEIHDRKTPKILTARNYVQSFWPPD